MQHAFNQLNRKTALLNTHVICPPIAPFLSNLYRKSSSLYVGGEVLTSQEGTTQGCPACMILYAIGILPLMLNLDSDAHINPF